MKSYVVDTGIPQPEISGKAVEGRGETEAVRKALNEYVRINRKLQEDIDRLSAMKEPDMDI